MNWKVISLLCIVNSISFIGAQTTSVSPVDPKELEKCKDFSVVNQDTKEFKTPSHPDEYPRDTECILQLSAQYGYLISIDFRDFFELEPSKDCENDYLEIRDGAFLYSDLIGKFCGTKFPPKITSKDRHLWLKFKSDDTIQYRGFKAVYEFVKTKTDRPEPELCEFHLSGEQGLISHTKIPQSVRNYSAKYGVSIECTWIIMVDYNKKVFLHFKDFKLQKPNECDLNFFDVFQNKKIDLPKSKHFCGSAAEPVCSDYNIMRLRFYAMKDAVNATFKAWFTAFRDHTSEGEKCEAHEYNCQDSCIESSLVCNNVSNCYHEYDEEDCDKNKKGNFDINSEHIIIILTLGCGLLGGMCFAMCFNCIKKLVRDGRQIHENIRRSREQLEEQRSVSIGSSPKMVHRGRIIAEDVEANIEGKINGHTCMHPDEEDTEEEEDEEEEDEEESCVEMRDCECQTRDSLLAQRDSGLHGTPPPPPPPTRRPPGLPPLSPPLAVPTPPPPPTTHSPYYNRHHHPNDPYVSTYHHHHHRPTSSQQIPDNESGGGEPYKHKHRTEALIQMKDRPKYEVTKAGKTTPDVLVTH